MWIHILKPPILSLLCALLLLAPEIGAQQADATSGQQVSGGVEDRRNEFGVWGGLSFADSTLIGKTPDARFGTIGLRYGRVFAANENLALSWTIDVVPVAVLSVNANAATVCWRFSRILRGRALVSQLLLTGLQN